MYVCIYIYIYIYISRPECTERHTEYAFPRSEVEAGLGMES